MTSNDIYVALLSGGKLITNYYGVYRIRKNDDIRHYIWNGAEVVSTIRLFNFDSTSTEILDTNLLDFCNKFANLGPEYHLELDWSSAVEKSIQDLIDD